MLYPVRGAPYDDWDLVLVVNVIDLIHSEAKG